MDVSVVISTRNRSGVLASTLGALLAQSVPAGLAWEIVVVDNGSSDDTPTVARSCASASPVPLRYAREPRRGVSYARNSGLLSARGRLVSFIDDDVRVDQGWLDAVVAEYHADPELTLLTGRVVAAGPGSLQLANTRSLDRLTLTPDRLPEGVILGCNLTVRREAALTLGGFDTRLGTGRGLACDDIDFTYRAVRAGLRVCFSPLPVVYHEPAPHARHYLRGWGAFYVKFILKGDRVIARQAWWEARRVLRELRANGRQGAGPSVREARELLLGGAIMLSRLFSSHRLRCGRSFA